MPGSGRKYGVQVGNETYSLVMTQEDWEKRRLDREHARKLSLATNKRRRALDDRKRLAEMRENRKRELELFKRRQRQIEATERYQRYHINVKDRRDRTSDFNQTVPNLEEILQKLRGGDGDSNLPFTHPEYDYDKSARQGRPTSQQHDKQQQPSNQTPRSTWQSAKEYSEDLNREILGLKHMEGGLQQDDDNLLDDDGQDSLHGSSISGSSSQPSSVSINYSKQNENSTKLQQFNHHLVTEHETTTTPQSQKPTYPNAALSTHVEKQEQPSKNIPEASGNFMHSSETGVLCKRDSQTGRITYYVKAYRPWSAGMTNKPRQSNFNNNTTEPLLIRPSSSYEGRKPTLPSSPTKSSQKNFETWTSSAGYIIHNKTSVVLNQSEKPNHERSNKPSETSYIDIKPSQTRAIILGRTTATPVSPFFDGEQNKMNGVASTSVSSTTLSSNTTSHAKHDIASDPKKIAVTKIAFRTSFNDDKESNLQLEDEYSKMGNDIVSEENENKKEGTALKGILRRYSKYDTSPISRNIYSHPAYQSAGVARQKWLHGINVTPSSNDDEHKKEARIRSAETKSVRWHQVQYNDGTSSALDMHENITMQPPPSPVPKSPQIVISNSARSAKPTPKKSPTRPKTSPARGIKGGKVKGGRKLRPAKEVPANIKPHPPPQKKSPKLSMSTCINYSIDPNEDSKPRKEVKSPSGGIVVSNTGVIRQRPSTGNNSKRSSISHNKIMFHRKGKSDTGGEAVTMSTLKSRGNLSQPGDDIGNVVVNQGNQVTINVTSTKPINYGNTNTWRRNSSDVATHRIPLNGTPTDQEIELLWDKVRAYLAWNKNRNINTPKKLNRGTSERKVAWGSNQPDPSAKHISANIISIDGGIFSKNSHPDENSTSSTNGNSQYKSNGTHQIQSQMDRYGISKSRKIANSYSPTIQQQYIGQDYGHWNGSQFQLREKARGAIPVVTNGHPASAPVRRQQLTESVKTFRLVEALIEQNVPEEQILKALNSLQTATREV